MLSLLAPQAAAGNVFGTLILLVGLELVLGVDNVLVIALVTSRLRREQQNRARVIGLGIALVARMLMLTGVVWLMRLSNPLFTLFGHGLSGRDLILLGGGLFLIAKAAREIHHVVELVDEHEGGPKAFESFRSAVAQIVALDIVFSLDSVITAVGLTNELWVILSAVVLSFVVVLSFARPVGDFILKHPGLKVLALSFLITIGVTLCVEAFGSHVPKAYLYLPMGFAFGVQLLQLRLEKNRARVRRAPEGGPDGGPGDAPAPF